MMTFTRLGRIESLAALLALDVLDLVVHRLDVHLHVTLPVEAPGADGADKLPLVLMDTSLVSLHRRFLGPIL